MKKFKFSLQKLLDIRQAREDGVRNELMKILAIQNREKVIQDDLIRKIESYERQQTDDIKKGVFSPDKTMAILRYTDISRRAIVESIKRAEAMEPEIQVIRDKLLDASRERKIVEKLKERKKAEYDYEINREIVKENDDMNQKIFFKKTIKEY